VLFRAPLAQKVLQNIADVLGELLQVLKEERIQYLCPAWFFDTPFKVDEALKAASVIADIRSPAASLNPVPQPLRRRTNQRHL
jgi:hypothetical protein